MKVTLAGFNVDAALLDETRRRFGEAVTPEVISAAYARISRDPRSVAALRQDARGAVEKARRSNERIVFGLGHASVAEHAVVNLDLTGLSRLAVEELERFPSRLVYGEIPALYPSRSRRRRARRRSAEAGLEREFRSLVGEPSRAYEAAYRRIEASGEDPGSGEGGRPVPDAARDLDAARHDGERARARIRHTAPRGAPAARASRVIG